MKNLHFKVTSQLWLAISQVRQKMLFSKRRLFWLALADKPLSDGVILVTRLYPRSVRPQMTSGVMQAAKNLTGHKLAIFSN